MQQLSELVDTKVVDATGKTIGSVDELVLDCQTGKIDRIIVRTSDHTRFSLDWEDLSVRDHQFVMKKQVRS